MERLRALAILFAVLIFFIAALSGRLGSIICVLSWVLLSFGAALIGLFMYLLKAVTEDEVYDAVSGVVWKTTFAIEEELNPHALSSIRLLAGITVRLAALESEGLVESRKVTRGRRKIRGKYLKVYGAEEFRRKAGGTRRRRRMRLPLRSLVPLLGTN